MASGDDVLIVHLDTGFDPDHKTVPQNLDPTRQRNFVEADKPKDATDRTPTQGILTNRGHGTGTLGILAGKKLSGMLPSQANTNDYLGGAPLAQVVPVRIANSVVHLWTSTVAQGFDYARQINADVVSMSMGGLPSAAWADAVNAAYEAGIVLVCAAGNNFGGWPTDVIVWPARFNRVLAACGIMANGQPYFNLPSWVMQGNCGPPSAMTHALAGFTPNISWAKLGCENVIDLDGAGTSSATPQIAAAAALWLRKYKSTLKYKEPWKRVEAVRKALFDTADRAGRPASDPDPFFGEGIMHANAALAIKPAADIALQKTPADEASFAFLKALSGFGMSADQRVQDMLGLELTQLASVSAAARQAVPDPGMDPAKVPERARKEFFQAILDEGKASQSLRRYLEGKLERTTVAAPSPPTTEGKAVGSVKPPPTGTQLARRISARPPARRRLQIFAVDPGASNRLETAFINRVTVDVPWETTPTNNNLLRKGPVGEYVEVVDVDPASGVAYEPVDLNDPFYLAQDGLTPSEGNPKFHQQMVYAVVMRTIETFESALGRRALWASKRIQTPPNGHADGAPAPRYQDIYIPRLRIYPHALRQANAYYSPDKIALLLGYFPEQIPGGGDDALGGMVFTCLSHDIVAHECTHALLDGLHHRYQESTNSDVLAFHEAFADLIAIFQHFQFPELLRFELSRTRGDLRIGQLLAGLAIQFGQAIGRSRALRSAIGVDPAVTNYATAIEPHDRGSILVAAIFEAFLSIYDRRIEDLLRIATNGTGILQPGAISPDLVNRLAAEAAKTAGHVGRICIRALDYCPPVDITFGDYLRALITADSDLVGEDKYGYRVAFVEAFQARGIYPENVRTLSVESVRWHSPTEQPANLGEAIRQMNLEWGRLSDRRQAYDTSKHNAALLHAWLSKPTNVSESFAAELGLNFSPKPIEGSFDGFERGPDNRPRFEVHSVRPAHRVTPDGDIKTDVIVVITQRRRVPRDPKDPTGDTFIFRGGCTLVVDPSNAAQPICYSVIKSIWSEKRMDWQRQFQSEQEGAGLHSLYFAETLAREPFALLHLGH
jgi:subtilase family protein